MPDPTNWIQEHLDAAHAAASFEALAAVAIQILLHMSKDGPCIQVCGPITTGGYGCEVKNRTRLKAAIDTAAKNNHRVFDQTPFGYHIKRIGDAHSPGAYDKSILNIFFREVFGSGHIKEIWILPGSEGSVGVEWEIAEAKRRGIVVRDFPKQLLVHVDSVAYP